MGMHEPQLNTSSPRLDGGDLTNTVLPPAHRLPLYPVSGLSAGRGLEHGLGSRRMSAPELPPIGPHRSLSSPSYANKGQRSPTRVGPEKRTSPNGLHPTSPVNSTPRSSLSATGIMVWTPRSSTTTRPHGDLSRAKSWCATENNQSASNKLGTVFEINNNDTEDVKANGQRGLSTSSEPNSKASPTWRRSSTQLETLGRSSPKTPAGSPANRRVRKTKPNRTRNNSDGGATNTSNRSKRHDHHHHHQHQQDASKSGASLNLNRKNLEEISKQNGACFCDECDTDSADGKDERIIEWLIGVESSSGETLASPPPIEINDKPEKTDTAIHIIYEGD